MLSLNTQFIDIKLYLHNRSKIIQKQQCLSNLFTNHSKASDTNNSQHDAKKKICRKFI